MTKILGIHYGKAKVGLAMAESSLATPLYSLNNNEQLINNLVTLVKQEQIELIVCGVPEGKLVEEIEEFARKLEFASKIKIVLHPETLSSQDAIRLLREGNARRAKLKNDHMYAAALILEDYWDQNSVN